MSSRVMTDRLPGDLAVRGLVLDDCRTLGGEDDEYEVQPASRPRATATQLYANYMGVSFQEVSCKVAYLRILTRQESFEYQAQDAAYDAWIDAHVPPLKLNRDLKWATPDGALVGIPAELDVVPADWEPSESDPVWEFCGSSEPGAMQCWRLEIRAQAAEAS